MILEFFCCSKSSKSGVCFTQTTYFSSKQPHCQSSYWPPWWTAQTKPLWEDAGGSLCWGHCGQLLEEAPPGH